MGKLVIYWIIRWLFSFQLELSRQQGQREEQQVKLELNSCLQEQGRLESEEKVFLIWWPLLMGCIVSVSNGGLC